MTKRKISKTFSFSLTLIDTLDTLALLGEYAEFEGAVKKVLNDVSFNQVHFFVDELTLQSFYRT